MTAIVGVLNKHAVAIAADSAVTMGNTHKVINSANKIFTLSKYPDFVNVSPKNHLRTEERCADGVS